MNVIIAGGTGLLGRGLSLHLAKKGWDVTILSRSQKIPETLSNFSNVRVLQWDAKTSNGWGVCVKESTVLINLAGQNPGSQRWSQSFKNEILSSRMESIHAMKEAIQKYQPALYVQASATGIYGNHQQKIIITDTEENTSFYSKPIEEGEKFRQEVCFQIEKESKAAVQNTNTKCCLLRLGIILSNEDGLYPYLNLASKFGCTRIGTGDQFMSWIHQDDSTSAIEFIIRNKLDGIFNIVSPTLTKNYDVMNSISKINGRYWNYIPIPSLPFQIAMGESASVVLDSQPVVSKKLENHKFHFLYPTIDEAVVSLSS